MSQGKMYRGGLHLFKQLGLVSHDIYQAEKNVTVAKPE